MKEGCAMECIARQTENNKWVLGERLVRCKDCKYYTIPKRLKKKYCTRGAYVKVKENDYCSYGENEWVKRVNE